MHRQYARLFAAAHTPAPPELAAFHARYRWAHDLSAYAQAKRISDREALHYSLGRVFSDLLMMRDEAEARNAIAEREARTK